MLAFEDRGDYLYAAVDATRAYATNKLKRFTRQVVFLRPGTFVIFDQVTATTPEFKKTWLLQTLKTPERRGEHWVVTHGQGRLFVQTLLPSPCGSSLVQGEDLYRYDGQTFPPRRDTGPAPECRLEVSPTQPSATDLFLQVLTATAASVETVPLAAVELQPGRVEVSVGDVKLALHNDRVAATSVGGVEPAHWRSVCSRTIDSALSVMTAAAHARFEDEDDGANQASL